MKTSNTRIRTVINRLGPLLALLAVYLLFALLGGKRFVNFGTTNDILMLSVIVGIAALGATIIIISGGIDLSIGCTLAIVTVIVAHVLNYHTLSGSTADAVTKHYLLEAHPILWPALAGLLGIAAAAGIGAFIGTAVVGYIGRALAVVGGILTAYVSARSGLHWLPGLLLGAVVAVTVWAANEVTLKKVPLPPFIVTLGLWTSLRGTAKWVAESSAVYPDLRTVNGNRIWLDRLMSDVSLGNITLPMPGVWIWLALAVALAIILKYTRFGRHVYAVGSNEQTARLCGISVEKTRILVYIIAICCGGLAGVLRYSWLGMGDPTTDIGTELLVIASVVIGGASLTGGMGSIGGTIVGTLIIMIVYKGCTVLGLPNFVQEIVTGAIIVAAVTMDQLRHRYAS